MSDDQDFSQEWREIILKSLCERPPGLTEVRRDGKDDAAVTSVIREELRRLIEDDEGKKKKSRIVRKMHIYAR
jgi:predicted component of type VI protein secretion system